MITKRIPQLRQLSNYLEKRTGFTIKPTHGILSQRQFLNAFAFKIFCSTQYLRNVKNPDYTPEPDIVHEIIGHIPLFSDPDIAVSIISYRKFPIKLGCYLLALQIKTQLSSALCIGLPWSLGSAKRQIRSQVTVLGQPAPSDKQKYKCND